MKEETKVELKRIIIESFILVFISFIIGGIIYLFFGDNSLLDVLAGITGILLVTIIWNKKRNQKLKNFFLKLKNGTKK